MNNLVKMERMKWAPLGFRPCFRSQSLMTCTEETDGIKKKPDNEDVVVAALSPQPRFEREDNRNQNQTGRQGDTQQQS